MIRVPRSRRWSTLNGLTLAEAVKSKEFAIYLFATSRDLAEEYYTNMIKDKNPMLTDYITGKKQQKSEFDALEPRYELLTWTEVWRETRFAHSASRHRIFGSGLKEEEAEKTREANVFVLCYMCVWSSG